MPRRIETDHKDFRDIVSGRIRKGLKKFIKSGEVFRRRGKNGKITIKIPAIDIPHFLHGKNPNGVGRGEGNEGDVIGKDKDKGQADGNQAGDSEGEGVIVQIDMEYILQFMKDELSLPNIQPKSNANLEEVKIKYNNISLVGPESLRHTRRTMLTALKRICGTGEINNLHEVPGIKDPIRMINPINADKRYRQFKEIKIPSSNAVVMFARDASASMDEKKVAVVSDMAYWIDTYIRNFYERVERFYVWHDVVAHEVDAKDFYRVRYGGGTKCSSALKLISNQFENRFPPSNWNIYVFYFTDGENFDDDNKEFVSLLKKDFPDNKVNLVSVTQIGSYFYKNSVAEAVEKEIVDSNLGNNVVVTEISQEQLNNEEKRNEAIINAIKDILGSANQASGAK
jgi:uncharacterized sporulation protein YeaH/YhbH (DUF444 family)